jgi:PAS domain S-box-containing protein/putative nucleotidyltransferase with HDIG domain
MQLHLSRESTLDDKGPMATPAAISADGSTTGQHFVDCDLFRTLVENVTDTIFLIDLDSEECIYVSPSVNTLLGLDSQALIGRPLTDFVHPDDRAEVVERSARRRRGKALRTTVTRMSHRDGRWVWVQSTASPVLSLEGRSATVFTVTNAAERVLAETGLRAARLRLRHVLDQINQPQERFDDPDGSYELTVETLAAALELRDDETGQHTRRVADLALALARAVEPTLANDRELRYGFLLHDIGKIGIPDSILRKRGRLTPHEIRTLEMHTILGEHLLSRFPFPSDLAHDVVAYHHERWDGTGYPWGLSESEIPLVARIFAVADAFDAMTSDRPYREATTTFEAIDEIERCAGTHFDPVVVEAFLPIARQLTEQNYESIPTPQ